MSIHGFEFDLLFNYSEWLDSQGLIVSDQVADVIHGGADKRTHEELALEFLAYRDANTLNDQDAAYVAINGEPSEQAVAAEIAREEEISRLSQVLVESSDLTLREAEVAVRETLKTKEFDVANVIDNDGHGETTSVMASTDVQPVRVDVIAHTPKDGPEMEELEKHASEDAAEYRANHG